MLTNDLYKQTTERIMAELREGTPPWARPWKDSHVAGIGMMPTNLATGRLYSGSNVLLLWMTATLRGYDSLQFCTFQQANEIGAKVKKGEKSTTVIFTKRSTKKNEETGEEKPSTIVKTYPVFHVSQLESVDDKYLHAQQPLDLEVPKIRVRELIANAEIDVRFGFNEACYIPSEDFIKMPAFGMFDDEAAFTGTLMHEATHWSGHESRLKRDFGKRFRSQERAAEELVAELGSAFLSARLGYQPTFRSASYINSWLAILNNDHRAVFTAASYAGHASDWIWKKAFGEESPEQETKQLEAAE